MSCQSQNGMQEFICSWKIEIEYGETAAIDKQISIQAKSPTVLVSSLRKILRYYSQLR